MGDPIVGRVLEGRYRIVARLARGGMSTVYRALDERLDRQVAVKVMSSALSTDPAFVDRFAREARVAARLSHPNAVAVYDQGADDGHVFLVMELVSGRTLRDLLRERGALPPALAVSIMEPVLGALAAAHRAGLVHRDVKPENILLADDGAVKVADFGLARAIEADASSTRTGLMMGTVAYCPPEQISRGAGDTRSDVYSAGIVLFELLTGGPPYTGDNAMAVAYQHVNSDVPPPSSRRPGIPPPLDEVVQRATRREPAARPLDAGAFLAELHDVRGDLGLPVVGVPPRNAAGSMAGDTQVLRLDAAGGGPPAGVRRSPDEATTAPTFGRSPVGPQHTAISERPPTAPRPGGVAASAPGRGPEPSDAGRREPLSPAARRRQRARRRAVLVVVVVLLLGLLTGYGAWWLTVGRYRQVPDVSGQARVSAVDVLQRDGFTVSPTDRTEFSETVGAGRLIGTDPGSDHRVIKGKLVTLILSKGPERFTVPTVAGQPLATAQAAFASIPVQLRHTDAPDPTGKIAKGAVIRSDPAAGQHVKRDQAVTLYVSAGPPMVQLFDLTGQKVDVATKNLTAAGFKVVRQDQFSDTVDQDVVISQQPGAGSEPKFSAVTLVVSKGPELVTIPTIANGTDVDQATRTLEALGLTVKVDSRFGGLLHEVVGMDPKAGTQVRKGSQVTITSV
jgi:serine/threonine-protein kinase